jgi:hypothetical protein
MMEQFEKVCKGLEKVWDAFNHMEHDLYADYVFDALALIRQQQERIAELEAELGQRDYNAAVEMQQYCERYEPTYNPEDGSM